MTIWSVGNHIWKKGRGMKRKEYTTAKERLNKYHMAWDLVQKQAEDEALLCLTDNIEVAYIQQELRKLHAVIEGEEEFIRIITKES